MIFPDSEKRLNKKKEKLKNDIAFLDLKLKKEAYKKSLNSGKFSKKVIYFCISFIAIFSVMCLYVQFKTGYDTYQLLKIIAAVFGGELLLLLFKRIFATNDKNEDTLINIFKNKINKKHSIEKEDKCEDSIKVASNSNSSMSDEIKQTMTEINSQIGVG